MRFTCVFTCVRLKGRVCAISLLERPRAVRTKPPPEVAPGPGPCLSGARRARSPTRPVTLYDRGGTPSLVRGRWRPRLRHATVRAPVNAGRAPWCVLQRVGERLLDDPVEREVDRGGEVVHAVDVQLDSQSGVGIVGRRRGQIRPADAAALPASPRTSRLDPALSLARTV